MLLKAVTARFDLLASMFTGAQDAKFVDFEPGSAELSAHSKSALDALDKALLDRQELTLDVPIGSVAALDRPGLIERKLQRQLRDALVREYGREKPVNFVSFDGDDQIELLEDLYKHLYDEKPKRAEPPARKPGQSGDEAEAAAQEFEVRQLQQALRASDEELDQLGLERAEAIERAVNVGGKLTSQRVLLTREREATAEQGKVRLALELE